MTMRQFNSPGASGEIPSCGCMPTGVEFRMASKNAVRKAQRANIIRVATVERTITPHHNGIHGADVRGQRLAFLQIFQNGLLVRQRHAESPDSKFRNRLEEIRQLMNEEWQIDSINFARHKPRVMQQRRERMSNGIADHAVNARPSRERVSAVEVLHLAKRYLTERSRLGDGGVRQSASFPQRQDSSGQPYLPHRNCNEIIR